MEYGKKYISKWLPKQNKIVCEICEEVGCYANFDGKDLCIQCYTIEIDKYPTSFTREQWDEA